MNTKIKKTLLEYGHKGIITNKGYFQCLTDKAALYAQIGHSYENAYPHLLERFLEKEEFNMLELGIHKGYSLEMWAKIFPQANIYGLDFDHSLIDPYANLNQKNIKILPQASQTDPSILNFIPNMDLIIDDASHEPNLTIKSWEIYRNKLNKNGLYIIEDVPSSIFDEAIFPKLFKDNFKLIDLRSIKGRDDDIILYYEN
jgi:fibrillarin-like rRNA methylase